MKFLRKIVGFKLTLCPVKKNALSRRMRLLNVIRDANENTPFYRGLYDKFLEHESDLSDEEFFYAFGHLPIIDEIHLQEDNAAFKSDRLDEMPNLLGNNNEESPLLTLKSIKNDYQFSVPTKTSDKIITRWLDNNDTNTFIQSTIKSFRKNGWNEGEPLTIFTPANSVFAKAYKNNAKFLYRYFGITVVFFDLLDKETVENLLHTLKFTKSTLLSISPSSLTRVAQIMHNEDIGPFDDLTCINASGGYFMDCSQSFAQKMFPDSDIQSSYRSSKYGTIAHQKGRNNYNFDVFSDFAFLEQGPNNSILITTHGQSAFPLIRYKIEDMGQIKNNEDGTQTIEFLEGSNKDHLIGADGYMYFMSYFNHVINSINKNLHDPIIDFTLRHYEDDNSNKHLQLNFILQKPEKKEKVKSAALNEIGKVFSNYDNIYVNFVDYFNHDYTTTLKPIDTSNDIVPIPTPITEHKVS